jgi:DNA polymerase I
MIEVEANPQLLRTMTDITVKNDSRDTRLNGPEQKVLADLFDLVRVYDPDMILFPDADQWVPRMVIKAEKYGLDSSLSRTAWFRNMASRSYFSYGKVEHKHGAMIPEGRILIDTENSFTYRESGIAGVILASRLTGLSPNLTSRFTPGTLISNYEVYEALKRGIAVPFRKFDAERQRKIVDLKAADKGGMTFQPKPGVHEKVYELDFTSFYPSIIVNYNLSPETLDGAEERGFLSGVIEPLLELRLDTKRLKKVDPSYKGLDSVLKWMLVTCFGYTGYKNAKFGRIEVHESITSISRELLIKTKLIAESMDLEVLHGIVDCLWVKGGDASLFKQKVEAATGIGTELDPTIGSRSCPWLTASELTTGISAGYRVASSRCRA